jgi:hypothetical protein
LRTGLKFGARARNIYEEHTRASAIDFIDHIIEKLPFRIRQVLPPLAIMLRINLLGNG